MLQTFHSVKGENIKIEKNKQLYRPLQVQLNSKGESDQNMECPESDNYEFKTKVPIRRTSTLYGNVQQTPTGLNIPKMSKQRMDEKIIGLKQTMNTFSINPQKKQDNSVLQCKYFQRKYKTEGSGNVQLKDYKSLVNIDQAKNIYSVSQKESKKKVDGKMRLRDYIFKAKISAELAGKKKRKQIIINKEKSLEKLSKTMISHPSTFNSVFKQNYLNEKYTISELEMQNILSNQIIQQLNKIKKKANLLEEWINNNRGKDDTNISQFYDLRRDLMLQNQHLKDSLIKISSISEPTSQIQIQTMSVTLAPQSHKKSNQNSSKIII